MMWRVPSRDLWTVHPSSVLGSPRRFMVYAVVTIFGKSSRNMVEGAATVKSSTLIATRVAALRVILWNRHVSASEWRNPWRWRRAKTAVRYVYRDVCMSRQNGGAGVHTLAFAHCVQIFHGGRHLRCLCAPYAACVMRPWQIRDALRTYRPYGLLCGPGRNGRAGAWCPRVQHIVLCV